jgi:hypothetical protein
MHDRGKKLREPLALRLSPMHSSLQCDIIRQQHSGERAAKAHLARRLLWRRSSHGHGRRLIRLLFLLLCRSPLGGGRLHSAAQLARQLSGVQALRSCRLVLLLQRARAAAAARAVCGGVPVQLHERIVRGLPGRAPPRRLRHLLLRSTMER